MENTTEKSIEQKILDNQQKMFAKTMQTNKIAKFLQVVTIIGIVSTVITIILLVMV